MVKNLPANARDLGSIPGQEDPREEGMTSHSRTVAWKIQSIEPDGLQCMGSQSQT